jgi:hypothetical protein
VVKKIIVFTVFLAGSLSLNVAQADTMKSVVRISCLPAIGLLDIEFRALHDSVASGDRESDRKRVLEQAGFYDPHGLKFSCNLGAADYQITAEQDLPVNKICGPDPEVYLSTTRGGERFVTHVTFGTSCNEQTAITRITIGDGPNSWRGRETQVCYSTNKRGEPEHCDWTFGKPDEFEKRFPIDQDRIQRIVSKQEYR